MKDIRRFLAPLLVALVLIATAMPALAGTEHQSVLPHGTVVSLEGTPHLWIADEEGTLHWGGDTRALANRFVNWGDRRPMSLAQLRAFRVGDPWLSAGLLKMDEPIYLVKWEVDQERPTLLHIQSIQDVETFGINGSNYGSFVLDRGNWEARFGMNAAGLARGTLAAAVAQPAPAAATPTRTTTTPPLRSREVAVNRSTNIPPRFETVLEISGATPGQRLTVRLEYEEYICTPSCSSSARGRWGPIDAGPVNAAGVLVFRDSHGPYREYTYTFADPGGNTVSISLGDDLQR